MTKQCESRNIKLIGPLLKNPLDKHYFKNILGDKRSYKQLIQKFVKKGVELSKQNGSVSVKLNVKEVWDYQLHQAV